MACLCPPPPLVTRIVDALYLYDEKVASYWTGKDLSTEHIDKELKQKDVLALAEYQAIEERFKIRKQQQQSVDALRSALDTVGGTQLVRLLPPSKQGVPTSSVALSICKFYSDDWVPTKTMVPVVSNDHVYRAALEASLTHAMLVCVCVGVFIQWCVRTLQGLSKFRVCKVMCGRRRGWVWV